MDVDGKTAAIIGNRHAFAIFVERHFDAFGMSVDGFVDRVVHDFPQQMVVTANVRAPDVHCGASANRLEPFEDFDVLGRVFRRRSSRRCR